MIRASESRGQKAAKDIQDFINGYGFRDYDVYDRTDDDIAIDFGDEEVDDIIPLLNRLHAWNLDADIYDHYIEINIANDDRW